MSLLAKTAFAQTISSGIASNSTLSNLVTGIVDSIVQPLVLVLFVVATVVFMWGIFGLIAHADDEQARSDGKQHILWGVIGMAIMISAYGVVRLLAASAGVQDPFL